MHESGGFPHIVGHVGQESYDVVLDLRLYGVDALNLKRAFLPDRRSSFLRHHAQFGKSISGMRLDFEPDTKFGFRLPDGNHIGTGIARDHVTNPILKGMSASSQGRTAGAITARMRTRSAEHTSELQSLMRKSYAVLCLKKNKKHIY